MQTTIINITSETFPVIADHAILTFRPFVDYLKKRREKAEGHIHRFLSFVIDQYELHGELLKPVDINDVEKYSGLLQLIYNTLAPIVEDEEVHYWALSLPLKPSIFYSTNAFFNLVGAIATCGPGQMLLTQSPEELKRSQLEFCYTLVLEKCYGITSFFSNEIIRSVQDKETKLARYYKLEMDKRFIEVHPAGPLPELKIGSLQSGSGDDNDILPLIEKILPLDMFRFEGFGIINITDITAQYAIENIKNIIFRRSSFEEENDYYAGVIDSLKTLAGNSDIEFGLLPVLQVNDRLVFNDSNCLDSILIRVAKENGHEEMIYLSLIENYLKNPVLIFYREITADDALAKLHLRLLKLSGVVSYAVLPIFFHNTVAGLMEVYSRKKSVLDESILSKLDPAIPLLSQLLKNKIDEFTNSVNHVIKEKFTSLQPAVQWKFNQAAWRYLKDMHQPDGKSAEMEEINFENLYPLYGAIDIRNSTIERNAALNQDLQAQFTVLLDVLHKLKQQSGFGLIDEKVFFIGEWIEKITDPGGFNQETKLNDFLENDIMPFLLRFREGNDGFTSLIEEYFIAIDEKKGIAYERRRQLETSMSMVISAVNNYMDMMKDEIQRAYPCYFEKFRTDGVEYDIYIGQSIAPEKPFSDIYLKNLRLLQLSSMATIAKYSHSLLAQLPSPVETTQLIFIHSNPIDIKFRTDEKRFDVEGAYNIRYHIVKKRIDKVRVKDSRQRLTQPHKIALVYFNQKEADEYYGYIRYLQDKKILADNLEDLDLEELQGVSGLRAMRVGVILE